MMALFGRDEKLVLIRRALVKLLRLELRLIRSEECTVSKSL